MYLSKSISNLLENPINSALRMKLKDTGAKTREQNTSGAFALLVFVYFKFVTICNKNAEECIWKVFPHFMQHTL